jgi:hypothetical protein
MRDNDAGTPADGEEIGGAYCRFDRITDTTDGYPWRVNHDSSLRPKGGRGRGGSS